MNKLVKSVDRANLYNEFLKSLNGILDLTDRELQLLSQLVYLELDAPKLPTGSRNIVSTENRKYLHHTLGIGFDNMSRYLAKFRKKGILVKGRGEDELNVNRALLPEIIGDRVQITIVLRIKKDEKENNRS